MKFTDKRRDVLNKLAKDERIINYNNLLFKTGDPIINIFKFLKRFGTLYSLVINLLDKGISIKKAATEQNEMIDKIKELKSFILLKEKSANKEETKGVIKKVKTKTHKKEVFAAQKYVIKDVLRLYDKRNIIFNAFVSKDILP